MTESPEAPKTPKTPQSTGFRRLVVMLAGVAVIAAVLVVSRDALRPPESMTLAPDSEEPDSGPRSGPGLPGADSTKKNAWVEEIPGADLAALDPVRAEIFLRFAHARRCTCGCGFTLAACRQYDPSCEVSSPLAAALLDSVTRGEVADTRGLRPRPHPEPGSR